MHSNKSPNQQLHHHLQKLPSISNLFSTVFSLIFIFSTSKPQNLIPKIPSLSFPQNPRRSIFLNKPSLIMTTMQNPNPNSSSSSNLFFPSPQSLSDWLKPRLPSDSFASWGIKPGTKNVHNLFLEIREGETSLIDATPPLRTVSVVTVRIIGSDGRFLVESRQELSDGSVRHRRRPLSEKMKPGETVDVAVIRAVREELGSVISLSSDDGFDGVVKIVPGSYEKKVETRVSVSYPGLPACYVLHCVDAWVDGLPSEDEFCTEEEDEYGGCDDDDGRVLERAVVVKKHFWKWVGSF